MLQSPKPLHTSQLKEKPCLELNMGRLDHNQTPYQINYCKDLWVAFSYQKYNVTVRKVKNKTVYCEEVKCQHLAF